MTKEQQLEKAARRPRPKRYASRIAQNTVYKVEGRDEKNCRRRMKRHLRAHPNDAANAADYGKRWPDVHEWELTSQGRKRLRRSRVIETAQEVPADG